MSARLFAPKANPEKLTVTGWALYAGDATTLPPLRTVSSGTERRMVTVHATIEQLIVHFVLIPAIRIIVRITRASLSTVSLFALSPFYYSLALIFSHSRSVWRALFMLGKLLRSFCMLKRLSAWFSQSWDRCAPSISTGTLRRAVADQNMPFNKKNAACVSAGEWMKIGVEWRFQCCFSAHSHCFFSFYLARSQKCFGRGS